MSASSARIVVTDSPQEQLTGRLLAGRYRLGRAIGQGGMGAVYEAVDEHDGAAVAIKLMHGALAEDPSAFARFGREAETMARLDHPRIARVLALHTDPPDAPFIVMELLRGASLAEVVRVEQTLAEARVARIAIEVLEALEVAHSVGVVHRDLKPANVFLVAPSESVKLLDFGVAKLVGGDATQLTVSGVLIGTPAYMAPEQIGGEADARTDLYALGAMMYHCLAGRRPFQGSWREIAMAIVAMEPAPLATLRPDVDEGFRLLIERAMAKDASMRFQSAPDMRAAIEAIRHRLGAAVAHGRVAATERMLDRPPEAIDRAAHHRADTPALAPTNHAQDLYAPAPAPAHAPARAPRPLLPLRALTALCAVALLVVASILVVPRIVSLPSPSPRGDRASIPIVPHVAATPGAARTTVAATDAGAANERRVDPPISEPPVARARGPRSRARIPDASTATGATTQATSQPPPPDGTGEWMNIDGRWQRAPASGARWMQVNGEWRQIE